MIEGEKIMKTKDMIEDEKIMKTKDMIEDENIARGTTDPGYSI